MNSNSSNWFDRLPERKKNLILFLCFFLGISLPTVIVISLLLREVVWDSATALVLAVPVIWIAIGMLICLPIYQLMKKEVQSIRVDRKIAYPKLPNDPQEMFYKSFYNKGFITYIEWLKRPRKSLSHWSFKLDEPENERENLALFISIIVSWVAAIALSIALIHFSLVFLIAPLVGWIIYKTSSYWLETTLINRIDQYNRDIEDKAKQEIREILQEGDHSHEADIDTDHGEVIRGDGLLPYTEVHRASRSEQDKVFPILNFAGLPLPVVKANQHIMFHAMTGSGKSQLIELLLESVLYQIEEGANVRVLVHDVGGEVLSKLHSANIKVTVVNPYDGEGANWLLGRDCQSEEAALQIAKGCTNLKSEKQRHEYFDEGAAQIIASIFIYLKDVKGNNWGLTDVCEIARDEDLLRETLKSTEFGKSCLHYLGDAANDVPRSKGDMLGTVMNTLNRMYIAVQKMKESSKAFSIREWINRPGILVFSYPSNRSEIVTPIYGMLLQCVFEEILSQQALEYDEQIQGTRQTYVFLDELLALPRLPGLPDILNQGRKFGASVILGLTSKAGLDAKYSEEVADGMINNCKNRFFGRCQGKDAQWSADMFFSVLTMRQKVAKSRSQSVSRSNQQSEEQSTSKTWQTGISRDYSWSEGKSYEPGVWGQKTGKSKDRTQSAGNTWSQSETRTESKGFSTGSQVGEERGETLDEHISEEQVVHPSEFMRYPDPLTGKAVRGVVDTGYGACKAAVSTDYIAEFGIHRIAQLRDWRRRNFGYRMHNNSDYSDYERGNEFN